MSDDLRELAVAAIAVPAAYVIWGRAVLARWIADPLGRNCAAAIAAYLICAVLGGIGVNRVGSFHWEAMFIHALPALGVFAFAVASGYRSRRKAGACDPTQVFD